MIYIPIKITYLLIEKRNGLTIEEKVNTDRPNKKNKALSKKAYNTNKPIGKNNRLAIK